MKLYMKFLLLTFLSATVVHAERGLKVQNSLNSVEIQNLNIGKKHAIIIGINSYKNGINPLKTAVNDAKEVQKILKETYGFETILITDDTATKDFILLSIENIARNAKPNDQIVIYYGGHGYFEKQTNTSYWMPSDATSTSFVKGIKSKDITDILKMSQSKQILVVADSCYSGTMDRDSSMQWKSTSDTRANFLQKQLRDVSRILLSSGGNEPVSDGYGKHSVFANYFLKKLKDFEKDVFTAEELYGSYKEAIGGNSEQIPEYKSINASGHEGGDFIFVKKVSSKPVEQIVKVEQVAKPSIQSVSANSNDNMVGSNYTFMANIENPDSVDRVELILSDAGITKAMQKSSQNGWRFDTPINTSGNNRPFEVKVYKKEGGYISKNGSYTVKAKPVAFVEPQILSIRNAPSSIVKGKQMGFEVVVSNPESVASAEVIFMDVSGVKLVLNRRNGKNAWVNATTLNGVGSNRPYKIVVRSKSGASFEKLGTYTVK